MPSISCNRKTIKPVSCNRKTMKFSTFKQISTVVISVDCVRPRPPANGTNGTIHSTPFNQYRFRDGEYIEYRCNDGYSLRGGSSRIFCSQGSWTGFPLCISKSLTGLTSNLAFSNIKKNAMNQVDAIFYHGTTKYKLMVLHCKFCEKAAGKD